MLAQPALHVRSGSASPSESSSALPSAMDSIAKDIMAAKLPAPAAKTTATAQQTPEASAEGSTAVGEDSAEEGHPPDEVIFVPTHHCV